MNKKLIEREKLIIENFNIVSNKLGMMLESAKFTSAVEAFRNSNDGDIFKLLVTNSSPTGHHTGIKGNKYTSEEILVKQGDYFIPQSDINISPDKFEHGRRMRREFSPMDLDKNNSQLLLIKQN